MNKITSQVIKSLKTKGLLNEKAVKKFLSKKKLNESESSRYRFGYSVEIGGYCDWNTGEDGTYIASGIILANRELSKKEAADKLFDAIGNLDEMAVGGIDNFEFEEYDEVQFEEAEADISDLQIDYTSDYWAAANISVDGEQDEEEFDEEEFEDD